MDILYIKDGSFTYVNKLVFDNLNLYLSKNDKICLTGRNGCGKSTLMKVINGEHLLDNGELFVLPGTTISYLRQDINYVINDNINYYVGNNIKSDNKYLVDIILSVLNLDGDQQLCECSGGQLRKAHLARALITSADILLLDEPTNHLDIATIEWLENFIQSYNGAVICVSHDRRFLANITNKIWWLDRGMLRISDKGFVYFDEWREIVFKEEEVICKKLNIKLNQESEWLQTGVTARRKRNQKRLEQLKILRTQLAKHKSHLYNAKKTIKFRASSDIKHIQFILEANDISFSYSNNIIIKNFSFVLNKGEKVGILGKNGSGKSTLIKLITRQLIPQHGTIKYGANIHISYLDQYKTLLEPEHTLRQVFCPNGGEYLNTSLGIIHVGAYIKKFMFNPSLLNTAVATLSGGELNRLLLAKVLLNVGNLLILDEPTNDLDTDSLDVLIEILYDASCAMLIVSHDRDFLNSVVNKSLIFDQGKIHEIFGTYDDYQHIKNPKVQKISEKHNIQKSSITKKPCNNSNSSEALLNEIELLEQKILDLETILSDPDLYVSNIILFYDVSNELHNYRKQYDKLLTKWLNAG